MRVVRRAGPSALDWVVTWDGAFFATPARQGLSVNAQGEIFLSHDVLEGPTTAVPATRLMRQHVHHTVHAPGAE